MIDDTLEEDLPEEFRHSTLQINDINNIESSVNKLVDNDLNTKYNNWGSNIITPLNKISEKLGNHNIDSTNVLPNKQNTIQQTISITEDANNYFTFRDGVIEKAVKDCCEQFLDENADGNLVGTYLLTLINNWNSDKERLILLTTKTLVVVKYDFIALKRLEYKKMSLLSINEIIVGDLIYPNGSLIPRLNGLVDGVSNVLENCLFMKWSKNDKPITNFYEPRNRNMKGIRLIWNKEKTNFSSQWNPFSDDTPFITVTFHPLYFHKDSNESIRNPYNLDLFIENISSLLLDSQSKRTCEIHNNNIILENYIGLGSVIHNRNSLGFFKVRGKFSF